MKIKMNFVFLCAFAFFAVVHSETVPSLEEVKKYSSCYEYALCQGMFAALNYYDVSSKSIAPIPVTLPDPSSTKKLESCFFILKPKELQSYFQFLSKSYPFNSDSLSGYVSEYCSFDNDLKHEIFDKIYDFTFAYKKKSGDEGNEGTQSRLAKAIICEYNTYRELQSEGKCQRES